MLHILEVQFLGENRILQGSTLPERERIPARNIKLKLTTGNSRYDNTYSFFNIEINAHLLSFLLHTLYCIHEQ